MKLSSINVVLLSFLVFFAGITIGVLVLPMIRGSVTDERVLALLILVWLLLVRYAGRQLARRVGAKSAGNKP